MPLYIYDHSLADSNTELHAARKLEGVMVQSCDTVSLRHVVRMVSRHGVLITPTDTAQHTEVIEKTIRIARIMGIRTEPFTHYVNRRPQTPPTTAAAVPPLRQNAVAGEPSIPAQS